MNCRRSIILNKWVLIEVQVGKNLKESSMEIVLVKKQIDSKEREREIKREIEEREKEKERNTKTKI